MKTLCVCALLTVLMGAGLSPGADSLPTDEAGAIAYLSARGVKIQTNAEGRAVRLMSSGKPAMTAPEYALIGLLKDLEQMGLNSAPLKNDEWGFLKKLPKLKRLSIWHGRGFTTLEPFCGLPVESLTIGGCMGLRDLNKQNPEKHLNAILTLRNLPSLTYGNWYHTPLIPHDAHLKHIAENFPTLTELRLDFAAPRGAKTQITPAGLKLLAKLPLKTLSLETVTTFTPAHFEAIAGIKTLEGLLIDARRHPVSLEALGAFTQARPDVQVAVADENAQGPPRLQKRKK